MLLWGHLTATAGQEAMHKGEIRMLAASVHQARSGNLLRMLGWAAACLLDSEFACRFISYSSDLVEVDRGVDSHHCHFILGQRACKAGGGAAESVAQRCHMFAPHTISPNLGHVGPTHHITKPWTCRPHTLSHKTLDIPRLVSGHSCSCFLT